LMVLITPRLVRPLDPDEVPPLPTVIKPGGRGGGGGSGSGSGGVSDYMQGGAGLVDAPPPAGKGKSGR